MKTEHRLVGLIGKLAAIESRSPRLIRWARQHGGDDELFIIPAAPDASVRELAGRLERRGRESGFFVTVRRGSIPRDPDFSLAWFAYSATRKPLVPLTSTSIKISPDATLQDLLDTFPRESADPFATEGPAALSPIEDDDATESLRMLIAS